MNKHFIVPLLALGLAHFTGCKKEQNPAAEKAPSSPAAAQLAATAPPFDGGRKTSFHEVASQLDPGGSLYLYLATDQWLNGLSKKVSDLRGVLTAMAQPGPQEAEQIERGFDLATSLIQRSGIEDATGIGLSAAPVAPGLFRNKFIVHHTSGAGQGFLWSMFGKAPHPLAAQDLLPSTTALAAFGDLDVAQLWTTLQSELTRSGIPQVAEMARAFPQMFQQQTGISWAELLASLDGEAGLILTLDPATTVSIPIGGPAGAFDIPTPGLVAAVKVKNDLLYDHLSAMFKKNPQVVAREEGGLKSRAMDMPNPLGLPLQLTVASSGDYFFFATTSDLVRTVQAVRKGKEPGLKSTPEFQKLAKHLPAQGNQFIYLSARFGEAIAELQKQAMASSGLGPSELGVLQSLLGFGKPNFSLSIGAHTANGWQTTSVGNQDSAATALLAPTVGIVAMAAAVALPAVAKAKSRAQSINNVNSLKQLGLAARMYSNDNKDKFPPADKWCDVLLAYAGSDKVYKAKNDASPGRCSFAYNAKLSGMDEARISPQTVLFFEAESGWNVSGGLELLLSQPRQPGTYVIGFADGSVQQIPVARVRTLRWEP
jgi:hypothetical protein